MCLIIDSKASAIISRALLANAQDINPDGWGIMSAEDGRIITSRGMGGKRQFRKALAAHHARDRTVHFRQATHGTVGLDNCHPFPFGDGQYALMHNGILSSVPIIDKSRSDTYHFVTYVIEPMLLAYPDLFTTAGFPGMIGDMVGPGNKLVILRADGAKVIVNQDRGIQHEGHWLSNGHSLPRAATPTHSRYRDLVEIDPRDDYMSADYMRHDYMMTTREIDRHIADMDDMLIDDMPMDVSDLVGMSIEELSHWLACEPDHMAWLLVESGLLKPGARVQSFYPDALAECILEELRA